MHLYGHSIYRPRALGRGPLLWQPPPHVGRLKKVQHSGAVLTTNCTVNAALFMVMTNLADLACSLAA